MARRPSTLPTKRELLDAIDVAEADLENMVGRWHDSIPEPVRLEIRAIARPLLLILLQARRRQPRADDPVIGD